MIKQRHQNGFSLLEMLLSLMVLTGIMIVIFNTIENYSQRVLAKSNAEYINLIAQSVEDILNNPTYFQAIYTDADSKSNDILPLTLDDLKNGFHLVVSGLNIPVSNVLDTTLKAEAPWRSDFQIYIKKSSNIASPSLDVIIALEDRFNVPLVEKSASFLKGNGGYLVDVTKGIQSAYNSWIYNLSELTGTPWATIISGAPPSLRNGAYLVYYNHMAFEDVTGDYLYRIRVNGQPELNRMYTSLDLGNYNIISADDINPSGTLTLDAKAIIKGSTQIQSDATINHGNFMAGRRLTTSNASIASTGAGSAGNFTVQGTLDTSHLNVSEDIMATDAIMKSGFTTSGAVQLNTAEIQGNLSSNSINLTNYGLTNPSGAKTNMTIGATLAGQNIQSDTLDIQGINSIGLGDLKVNGSMIISDDLNTNNLNINILHVDTFGACDNGC